MRTNIIFRAPVYSQSGYGSHSKDIVLSLWQTQKFNLSVVPTEWGGSSLSDTGLKSNEKDALFFMTNNKIHKDVPFIFAHVGIPTEFQKIGKINVGITAGLEANKINQDWVNGCNLMDLIIVPTTFVKETFQSSGVTTRVEVVGEGVDTTIFNNTPLDIDILKDISTPVNILSTGQWLPGRIGEDRKGIGILIDTFMKAFENDKKVGLILKTYINNNSSVDHTHLIERMKDIKGGKEFPRIHVVHGNLTNEEMASLYKSPKVCGFVSMTSGEGWGRGIAEAAACDLPIVVTGWSGHMDYINSLYSKTIDFNLKQVPRNLLYTKYFTSDMVWAYPNIEDAKRKVRNLVENPISHKSKAKEFGSIFRKNYNKDVVYERIVELFDELSLKMSLGNSSSIILEKI